MSTTSELNDRQMQNPPVGFIEKLLRSEDGRRSRLHDRFGNRVSVPRLALNGPRALASCLALKAFGRRPIRPWISYSAAARLRRLLQSKPCTVLEFGSGMSTLWFARYAARLHSIENDPNWFNLIEPQIKAAGQNHCSIEYVLEEKQASYSRFKVNCADQYDIILYDGPWREACIRNHAQLVSPGGMMYLDNSDMESSSGEPGEMREASKVFRAIVEGRSGTVMPFTDFTPTNCFASQGLLGILSANG